MLYSDVRRSNPELKQLVREATLALAQLDAERLEELALSCQALNRDLPSASEDQHLELARQMQDANREMTVLGRVLQATRANMNVMNRLRELREGRMEYGARLVLRPRRQGNPTTMESRNGND